MKQILFAAMTVCAVQASAAGVIPLSGAAGPSPWLHLVVGLAFVATVRRRRNTTARLA